MVVDRVISGGLLVEGLITPAGGIAGYVAEALINGSAYVRKDGAWSVLAWSDITGVPATFAPSAHGHPISDITGLQTALDGKAAVSHSHAISDVTGLQTALDGKVASSRSVATQHSLTGGGDLSADRTLSLVGDSATPGSSKYYGTDGSGTKGFHSLPGGLADAASDGTSYARKNGSWVAISWSDLADKPSTFSPSTHSHAISDVTGLQTALDGKAAVTHSHAISDVTGLQTALDAKVASSRSVSTQHSLTGGGDLTADRTLSLVGDSATPGSSKYYGTDGGGTKGFHALPGGLADAASDGTSYARKNGSWVAISWNDLADKPSTFAPSTHSHAISDVTGLQTALDGKLALAGGTITGSLAVSGIGADVASTGSWRFVVRDPSTNELRPMTAAFARGHLDAAAVSHSHTISDTTGLQTALDGKAAVTHSHAISDVTGLQTALDAKVASSRSVSTQHSLTGGGDLTADRTLSLVGDSATPGNSKYYGTDGGGTKGYHALPSGSANVQPVTKKTAPYTATSADGIILCAFDSPTEAITLPTSGLSNGQVITVTRVGGAESVYIYHGATLADELSVVGDSRTYVWLAADSAFYLIQTIPLS